MFGTKRFVGIADLAPLCRQISFMLSAGVSLKTVIQSLADAPQKNRQLKFALKNTLEGITRGESLSFAFEQTGCFPPFMCNMCKIGEFSDNLPKVMQLLADYYEEMFRNKEEIRSALIYPAIISVMMLLMIIAAVVFVLPNYAMVFEMSEAALPLLTRVLLAISETLSEQYYIVVPIVLLVLLLPRLLVKTALGREYFERFLLFVPPISIVYRQIANLYIVQALALLLQSGQPLANSIPIVSGIMSNKKIAADLQNLSARLQEGSSFYSLLANISYIDPTIIGLVRAGEETGNMPLIFEHASKYSRYQFSQMSKRLNKLVEPIITLVLGVVLGLVMLAIMLPTFTMTEFLG
ncbi:MAG: type II secretion system F family protein [Defluviitaleaceae bacterium]|nr:type II secretion system F family protein [Defluviitaleaceae bacterium]